MFAKPASTLSIQNVNLAEKNNQGWMYQFARSAVHKVLQHLQYGQLIIHERGQTYRFGKNNGNSDLVATITVENPGAYTDVLFNGTIGSGESYMMGYWTTPDLVSVIRVFVSNMAVINRMDKRFSLPGNITSLLYRLLKRNSKEGSRRNISAHYDLGNDFFHGFLDSKMMYSSAIYPQWQSGLEAAAEHKLKTVCDKLQLKPSDHLLEVGSGWGGMAIYAAKHYGCKVTTTTISKRQYEFAKAWIEREGLQDKIELILKDYRDLDGQYDKLVSIEMIEAVGHRFYRTYFKKCASLLKADGLMLIQAITIPDQRYEQAKRSVDFIQKYIFPGGCLPSNTVISQHLAKFTDMQIVDLEDITAHYAKTLEDWRLRFEQHAPSLKAQGFNETFTRMWRFYLCYCEGGFTERVISTAQFVFAKPRASIV